jgi:N-hydroxyarylamine O-acetyltransferase
LTPELLTRYLDLLGVKQRLPSTDSLHELVQAQVVKIPFENLSKLYYKETCHLESLPSLELYLDGIERFHFGGTCYSNNYHFYQLLATLGYHVRLCGADMSDPDVHLVSIVTLEQREYLVDVGYAAPFLNPLPLDLKQNYMVTLGRDRYVFRPRDNTGRSQMELYRDGSLKHGYCVNPAPRQIHEFRKQIEDSYRAESTFMNTLLLARFFPGRSLVLHNLTLIESQGTATKSHTLNGRDELVQAINDYFSISGELSETIVMSMPLSGSAWN